MLSVFREVFVGGDDDVVKDEKRDDESEDLRTGIDGVWYFRLFRWYSSALLPCERIVEMGAPWTAVMVMRGVPFQVNRGRRYRGVTVICLEGAILASRV